MEVEISATSLGRIAMDLLSEEHPIGMLIVPSGLHLLRVVDTSRTPHKELLSALAERWWPTTNTFHFGWGEMTMTPADFSAISGIPFGTRPLEMFDDWRQEVPSAQMIELIGIDLPRTSLRVARSTLFASLPRIHEGYYDGSILPSQAARFFILLLISATFYVNTSQAVHPGLLRSLVDLSALDQYDWAGAMLSRLYEDMSELSDHRVRLCSLSAFWEIRTFIHFPFFDVQFNLL